MYCMYPKDHKRPEQIAIGSLVQSLLQQPVENSSLYVAIIFNSGSGGKAPMLDNEDMQYRATAL
ncbi:hypothetical protein N7509_001403 [Penicillium cosmopolitanum]|uniref:Uncharacterized protein n=1 Tax=Penicillium cosmopolitanum TaxID=1131564 RepID=A0A9W9WCA2_9EURO|nr:uncharacterized protein N7509_001403 [Penicillium cosmopolitanum]KAJ5414776.1 hypothetical protein N7509_001403 [Penicillium cosmopolitanum]